MARRLMPLATSTDLDTDFTTVIGQTGTYAYEEAGASKSMTSVCGDETSLPLKPIHLVCGTELRAFV